MREGTALPPGTGERRSAATSRPVPAPRLLVVTDVHLDSQDPGAIYLRTLCEMYPRDRLAVCHVTLGEAALPRSLSGAAHAWVQRPREHGLKRLGRVLARATRSPVERYLRSVAAPRVSRQVTAFGRAAGSELVLAVLNGPTTICAAAPAARALGVPLVTMVWDPIEYRLGHEWGLAGPLAAPYLERFGRAVRASRRCGVMSEGMQRRFSSRYEVDTVILRLGVPRSRWNDAPPPDRGRSELVITFAGNFYAHDEWAALMRALDRMSWRVGGRDVRVKVLSGHFATFATAPMRVEFLGWHSAASSVRELAASDLAYLPYWLDARYAEPAELSFPSKLSAYVAAGCPVFFHGPSYASVTEFMARYPLGTTCHTLDANEIGRALERCAADPSFRERSLRAGRAALEEELGLEVFRRRFARLLGVADDCLLPAEA